MAVERLDPLEHDDLEVPDHYARYAFASQYARHRRVLDVACGTGYGAELLLASGAASVVGIDRSREAIDFARGRHGVRGAEFLSGDAHRLAGLVLGTFDLIVSFETIEHLDRPDEFLEQCRRVAHPGTTFLFSVPNERDLPGADNPYHLHAFDREHFGRLLRRHFTHVDILPQYLTTASVVDRGEAEAVEGLAAGPGLVARWREPAGRPDAYLAVCSQRGDHGPAAATIVHAPRYHEGAGRAVSYLEGQREAWQRTAEERAAWIEQLEGQREAWQRTAEERAAWIEQLEAHREADQRAAEERAAWLEGQREAWQRTAEERAAWIEQLEVIIAEHARRGDELRDQLASSEGRAERQAETIGEQARQVERQAETIAGQRQNLDWQAGVIGEQARELDRQAGVIGEQARELDRQAGLIREQAGDLDRQAGLIWEQARQVERQAETIAGQQRDLDRQAGLIWEHTQHLDRQAGLIWELRQELDRAHREGGLLDDRLRGIEGSLGYRSLTALTRRLPGPETRPGRLMRSGARAGLRRARAAWRLARRPRTAPA